MNETYEFDEPGFSILQIEARLDALEVGVYAIIAALCSTAPEGQARLRQYLQSERDRTKRGTPEDDNQRAAEQLYCARLQDYQDLLQRIAEGRHR